jgi:type I restriction enzyme M protein
MYLHGFTTPQIFEYDTLSSEDRWNEAFDVILANPPFMTPKGGIRPHKKFGVQANKAEVLFTDYIAEHLNKNGRAGIVVPNGIVATTQTAYKQLRKLLVEDSLIAVVSLPAGCFNPYSGVKTSILMLDKGLAKKSKHILFIKISNDGFDLGAQRREIDKNDLPIAQKAFSDYKKNLTKGKPFDPSTYNNLCLLVEKEKILTNKNVVLSGDRYLDKIIGDSNYDYVPLSELFVEIKNGRNVEQFDKVGKYRVSRIQTIADGTVDLNKTKWTNDDIPEKDFLQVGDILLSHINSIEHLAKSAIFKVNNEKVVHGINLLRLKPNGEIVIPEYAAAIFKSDLFLSRAKTFAKKAVNQASISTSDLKTIEIPLPSIEIQEQIVKEIEGYQKIIDGAKMVVENYKPTITINPAWVTANSSQEFELSAVSDLIEFVRGVTYSKDDEVQKDGIKILRANNISIDSTLNLNDVRLIKKDCKVKPSQKLYKNDILICTASGSETHIGKVAFIENDLDCYFGGFMAVIRTKENLNPRYLFEFLKLNEFRNHLKQQISSANIRNLKSDIFESFKIPLPPLEIQEQIVKEIEGYQKIIDSNKQLITLFEQKIKEKINEVWGVKEEVI